MKIYQCRPDQSGFKVTLASIIALSVFASFTPPLALAQSAAPVKNGSHAVRLRESLTIADRHVVERAIGAVCAERESDPQGSVPIDEMQMRPSLPSSNPDAVAGARRAERLLPIAKRLTASAILQLAEKYEVSPVQGRAAVLRIQAVRKIKPDVDSRDNASVLLREPQTINFGTIFLAGLRSDEGMISVLAHELTHIANGRADSLHPVFRRIGLLSARLVGLRISGQRAEELTADLVGAMAARAFITNSPNSETLSRRLARSVEHNCVDEDESDENHLSPRNTMRALFTLDLALARDLAGEVNIPAPSPSTLDQQRTRRISLTSPPRLPIITGSNELQTGTRGQFETRRHGDTAIRGKIPRLRVPASFPLRVSSTGRAASLRPYGLSQ